MKLIFVICALALSLAAAGMVRAGQPVITLESLLEEMTRREDLAQFPEPAYVLKESSSHDRSKSDPADPKTWHSNNDHEQFIRVETNQGRQEWVMLDDQGPGAITRFWTPLSGDKDAAIVRFYLDGADTPAITAKLNELLSGRGFVPPPFAFVSWNDTDLRNQMKTEPKVMRSVGGDLYLPIPFARSCKITLDQLPFYFVINDRIYAAGTAVRTFSMSDFESAKSALDIAAARLTASPELAQETQDKSAQLASGEEIALDLPSGPSRVLNLRVKIDPKDAPQALRSLVVNADFDEEPCIWCPISEFFGAGARLHPVKDWFRTVEGNGTMSARWVMPYHRSGRISLRNEGKKPLAIQIGVQVARHRWDDRTLHFHANWRAQAEMKTRPMSDWNYIEIQGTGVYVGDSLTVYSPAREWYGEGDERIYIDGERLPSHIGTGTEDYYGYAWGMPNYFNSPFLSAPLRDSEGREDWRGYTTTSRMRLLDGIPFTKSLKHDMEIWNWADTQVDYAVGTFWYGRPGARSNREPQPRDAARALRDAPPNPRTRIAGLIECEDLAVESSSPGLKFSTQDVSGIGTGQ